MIIGQKIVMDFFPGYPFSSDIQPDDPSIINWVGDGSPLGPSSQDTSWVGNGLNWGDTLRPADQVNWLEGDTTSSYPSSWTLEDGGFTWDSAGSWGNPLVQTSCWGQQPQADAPTCSLPSPAPPALSQRM